MIIDAILDAIPKIAPVFTAGAAVWGAIIATRGLAKWKQETVGKRKLELAEDLVSGFHEIRDILEGVRFPGSFGNEGQSLERRDGEDDASYSVRASYFTPVERIMANASRFSEVEGKKYRAIAYFGKQAARPFEELGKIKTEIVVASRMLAQTPGDEQVRDRPFWNDLRAKIGWVESDKDEMRTRINGVVEQAESIFGEPLRTADK